VDSTFGSNGIFLLNNFKGSTLNGLAFNQTTNASGQAVNQIVAAAGYNGAFLLARLNGSNGTLDTSFNGQGYVISMPPTSPGGGASVRITTERQALQMTPERSQWTWSSNSRGSSGPSSSCWRIVASSSSVPPPGAPSTS
jgi:hypothetical protein